MLSISGQVESAILCSELANPRLNKKCADWNFLARLCGASYTKALLLALPRLLSISYIYTPYEADDIRIEQTIPTSLTIRSKWDKK